MPRPLSVTVDVAVGAQMHLDEGGVPGDGFVHRVVDDFREQVVQRLLVGAADIHAGAAADRLQPLQHLDVVGGIAAFGIAAAAGAGVFAAALLAGPWRPPWRRQRGRWSSSRPWRCAARAGLVFLAMLIFD